MSEYLELVNRVRAGRMAGRTRVEIARDLGVTYGVINGIIQRFNIGLPEEARAAIELARRGKCQEMGRKRNAEIRGHDFSASNLTRPLAMEEDSFVFDIESRGDVWDEFGEAYLSLDDSY